MAEKKRSVLVAGAAITSRWRRGSVVLATVCFCLAFVQPAAAWWYVTGGTANKSDGAGSVTVDPFGDVIAAGSLYNNDTFKDFAVVKLSGTTGAELWRLEINGTADVIDWASSVTVDPSGDVIAAGTLANSDSGTDFTVAKISGLTGAELWRVEIDGTGSDPFNNYTDWAVSVAVDATGDVIAAGRLQNTDTGEDFTVVKLSGASGAELWRLEIGGNSADHANAVTVDPSGDVIAVGNIAVGGAGWDFAVVKVSGTTGVELWRQEINGTANKSDWASSVTVDPSGDVIAVGDLDNSGTGRDFAVVKLSGTTGAELWRQAIDGTGSRSSQLDRASSVTVDPSGDVIVSGDLANSGTFQDFTVVKLSGTTGVELWRQAIDGRGGIRSWGLDWAYSVTVDPSGDVIAAGTLYNSGTGQDFAVVKLSGTTGAELWREEINGTANDSDSASSVTVDPSGDVIASGGLGNVGGIDADFAVVKFSGATGQWDVSARSGKRLVLKDNARDPSRRKIFVMSKDPRIDVPTPGSVGDPTLYGAELRIANPTTAEAATFSLPAVGWKGQGIPVGSKGYRYRARRGSNGPCKSVRIVAAKKLRGKCSGRWGTIPFTLDEQRQRVLAVALELGTAPEQCMWFGGLVRKDYGTSNPGPKGLFRAEDSRKTAAVCPAP